MLSNFADATNDATSTHLNAGKFWKGMLKRNSKAYDLLLALLVGHRSPLST